MKRKMWIAAAVMVLLAVLWCSAAAADGYGLYIGGVQVTDLNKSDILGDGVFTYNPTMNRLDIWGEYEATTDPLILNSGLDNLDICGHNANLSCPGCALELNASATMSGNWTISCTGTNDAITVGANRTLTIEERSKLTISTGGNGISGENGRVLTSRLVIDRSNLTITGGSGKYAVCDFADISTIKSNIIYPEGATIEGGSIKAGGRPASRVEIQGPPDPIELEGLPEGMTGPWREYTTWYVQKGTTITFTLASLAAADETFAEAIRNGKTFTYNFWEVGENTNTTLTANSSGVFTYAVPENAYKLVLQIFDDGEQVYYSSQIRGSSSPPPRTPAGLRWNGMTAEWDVPAAGVPDSYTVTLYHGDDTPAKTVNITPAGGTLATAFSFESSFPSVGQGDYYFKVAAGYSDGQSYTSGPSGIYRYTGAADFYTMFFEPGEGSGTMENATVDAGESYTLPESTFTAPSGMVFKGWENRGNGYAPGYTFTAGSNEIFTALWTSDPSEVLFYGAELDDISFTLKAAYSYQGQTAQPVIVRNTGTVELNHISLSLTGTNASAFEMRSLYLQYIEPKTESTGWTIKAARDLAPGTYTATLTFTADSIQPLTATVTLVVSDHQITPGLWASDSEYHWNVCSECSEQVNLARHDGGEIRHTVEPTFDTDGYSGDLCCTVCGHVLQSGHVVSAGKYIRESAATMVPATLTNAMCAGDLTVTSSDLSKYTAALGRVIDTTDINQNVNGVYPSDRNFIKGHTYYIEIEFTAVSPYVYDEQRSDYWSTFTLNGSEVGQSNAVMFSGSTIRKTELTAQDAGYPVIQTQPSDQAVPEGQEATFSVAATGGTLTYQWMYSDDDGTTWQNCTGASAKTANLCVTAAAGADGRMFHCMITNSSGSTVSRDARIFISPTKLSTPDFVLPKQLGEIKQEAFRGISAKVVSVPDGCTNIGSMAFAFCPNLKEIRIPANCTIGPDAFRGCKKVFVFSTAGSDAETYCQVYSNLFFVEEQP